MGLLLNYRYKQTNYYKNKFIDVLKFKNVEIPRDLEIVNLGSNQPKFAFDYSETGMAGMNWAIGPQSLEYDFRVFEKFHGFLKEEAFVLIPICPFKFFLFRYPDDSANYKYYAFLDPVSINNYSARTEKLCLDYPVLTAKRSLIRLIKDIPADKRLTVENNPMGTGELKEDAQKWINAWLKQFSLNSLENISLSGENKNDMDKNVIILREMIKFCLERNYRPVIMMLPVTKELGELFPRSFIDKYIAGNINKANTQNIPILNYLNDERFVSPDLYFNSFFFNKKGRKFFTNIVVNDLKSF
jgi:hypothetical protein